MSKPWLYAIALIALCQWVAGCASDATPVPDLDAPQSRAKDRDASRSGVDGCPAESGSPLDVASEPDWRRYGNYARWTDTEGCLVRIDVLAERPGPGHCDWQDTLVMITGDPFGTRYTKLEDTRHYVRDPNGSYGDPALRAGFDPNAELPSSAEDSGYRRGDIELWLDPEDDGAIYLKQESTVERWPHGDPPPCF